jgi:hypothetical protein
MKGKSIVIVRRPETHFSKFFFLLLTPRDRSFDISQIGFFSATFLFSREEEEEEERKRGVVRMSNWQISRNALKFN